MIVCDKQYLRELQKRMNASRKALPHEVAETIDREIDTIEAQGDTWYGKIAISIAFRMGGKNLHRVYSSCRGFQGHLPRLGQILYGTWFDACSVNKDNRQYRTWVDPDDAIRALALAHRIAKYEVRVTAFYNNTWKIASQNVIDKWRIEHGND